MKMWRTGMLMAVSRPPLCDDPPSPGPASMSDQKLVHCETQDGIAVLSFLPPLKNITEDILPRVSDGLLAATYDSPKAVLIDLQGIEFFGSSFIEVLFRVWNTARSKGAKFALCNVAPYCREIFTVTNLERLWGIHDSREQAVAAFK